MKIDTQFLSSKLFIAAAATFLIFIASLLPQYEIMERRFLDFSFVARGSQEAHPDIVIVEINDESLRRIGSWPWPRSYHAALLNVLNQYKPSAIFFDMIFSETSNPQEDTALAEEIKKLGNVVLPFYYAQLGGDKNNLRAEGLPIDLFMESAYQLGYVNATTDSDGHIRELPLMIESGGDVSMIASLAAASIHEGLSDKELERFRRKPNQIINYPGKYETFTVVPYEYVIAIHSEPWAKKYLRLFKDKVVLIGHTATGTALDLKPSPFSPQYPGVGLQASMIHTILSDQFIGRVPRLVMPLILFLFAYCLTYFISKVSPVKGLLYALGLLALAIELSLTSFIYFNLWLPAVGFMILAPILYVSFTLIQFVKVQFERELLNRELTVASKIQESLLPDHMPDDIPDIKIEASSNPAKHVGGDLYDVIRLKEGKWGVCVGDVSGKGVPAALFMARALSEFRRESESLSTSDVISRLNNKLASEGTGGLFITLVYLILDPENQKFYYSSGGHEPILHYQKKNEKVELLENDEGLPLGIAGDVDFDMKEQIFEKGDTLILQSDGVKEAMNLNRDIFGFERAQNALLESASGDVSQIVANLKKRIAEFVGKAPQHDDTTIVCIKHT